jgi:catechol 2,3-dioxygenase-like lactoylglutathione lyase family enzyme
MSDISFLLLYVDNVAASQAFYAQTLGRKAVESSPTFAIVPAAPGVMLGLWKRNGVEPKAEAPGAGAFSGEIAFALDGDAAVDAAFAEWRARGVEIAQPPTRLDFGYAFLGLDPDGHRLRVFAPGPR